MACRGVVDSRGAQEAVIEWRCGQVDRPPCQFRVEAMGLRHVLDGDAQTFQFFVVEQQAGMFFRRVARARMVSIGAWLASAEVGQTEVCATAGPAASSASTDRLVCPRDCTLVIVYAKSGGMSVGSISEGPSNRAIAAKILTRAKLPNPLIAPAKGRESPAKC